MTKKRGKKERKEEKLKKKLQKDVQITLCFQNRAFSWCVAGFVPDVAG